MEKQQACVHESVTVGTSDVGVPGMVPAVQVVERALDVAASSVQGQRVSQRMLE